jgi:hypothetical protein
MRQKVKEVFVPRPGTYRDSGSGKMEAEGEGLPRRGTE